MIKIPKEIVDAIFEQAKVEAPLEACGYLSGLDGQAVKRYPMYNVDQSKEHFTLDPKEQFAVVKSVRAESQKILAVYHSHPESPARPSEEDIRLAFDPNISYIIASLLGEPNIKSFRIDQGTVTNEELVVIS